MNSSLLESESSYAQNGKIFLASTTLLFLFLIIFIFFHSFRHTCFPRRRHNRRHRALIGPVAVNKGLQPSFLASLPTFTVAAATGDNCTVCMSEFATGDKGRALPSCRHAFHSHCIDVWFRSHFDCPICRTAVQLMAQPNTVGPDNAGLKLTNICLPGPIWCPRKALELEEEKLRKNSYFINIYLTPHM